jgi:serine/threonine protein kinase
MDRLQWKRVLDIYYQALPKAPSERSAFVASACNHDPVCLREVNLLLETEESASSFLEPPVFELGLTIIDAAAAREENLIGTTIDQRYLVEAEVGRGAMGRVYLARDMELHGKPVVIKILLQAVLSDPYVVKKFKQEVEALARVDHPNVVGLLGAGQLENGQRYTVMQRVTGLTLRSQVTNEGMNLERAASILRQIGAGLDHVHENGILHRDLKPENIMLQVLNDGTELVKIVDFGIAKVRESVVASTTSQNIPVGTLAYMSPEQLRGGQDLTPASDIFSMAVIAYEMITGRRPFNATSGPHLLELLHKGKCVKPVALRPGLSAEAQAIILRALSFNAKNRYQQASEFGNSLARALTTATKKPFVRESLFQRRTALMGLIVLILVAVLLSVYFIVGSNESWNTSRGPTHSLNYWLMVQKMRDERPYQEPFKSNGQETFESGDRFQVNVSCAESGCLYVFNEGPPEANGAALRIVYPKPDLNKGSSSIGADQPVQTNWITFRGAPGAENFWIVWSALPISELESAKNEAFMNADGGVTDQNLVNVRNFLKTSETENPVRVTRYKLAQVATVRGHGELLITLAQFQHR